ncbi:MAG: SPOR domain-containing protein [Methyloceanibacter sp.]|uniref:SPOR domain-containing protein n=1 Tax=Methyloceanibacter sp. TaxID=1965321 RepID=UPI003EDEE7B8
MAKRRTGGRGVARNVFAVLWIALAGLSGFYLFTLFTDPTALGGPVVQLSAVSEDQAPDAPPAAAAPPPAPVVSGADPADVSALKGTIQNLTQQLAALDARLQPIERFIGPVAALPPSASVSTSPPRAQEPAPVAAAPEPEPEAEVVEEEVVEETVVETPPPPPAPPPVATAPEPEPEPVVEAAPEPEAPAQVAVADEPEAAVAEEEVEIAAFDPVALPPAANDGSTRYGIEIGTVGKRDELRPLWREYLTKHAALVAGLQPRRVLAPDKKWRLIAGPFANAQDAEGACSLFQKADRPCSATVYAGDAL